LGGSLVSRAGGFVTATSLACPPGEAVTALWIVLAVVAVAVAAFVCWCLAQINDIDD
jgi:hypothetical protein